MIKREKNNNGYTLVEVLAAFAILSIAILPIVSMYPAVFRMNTNATAIGESSRIALSVVDFIKAKGYSNLTGINGSKPISSVLTRSNTTINNTDPRTTESSQDNTRFYLYELKQKNDYYITNGVSGTEGETGENAFEKDFNFGSGTSDFFVVNSRGFPIADVRIGILMRRAKVFVDGYEFRNPTVINESLKLGSVINSTECLYGFRTEAKDLEPNSTDPIDEFIVGKIIIGRGSPSSEDNSTEKGLEQKLMNKEIVYSLQFVVTPIEM